MERARARYEADMSERRKCFRFAVADPPFNLDKLEYRPIVPEHLDARIRWRKAWLDYGQAIGDSEMFTAAVRNTAHHPRRI